MKRVWLALATGLLAATGVQAAPDGPPVDGYALYRYTPPGWSWALAATPNHVASAAVGSDGACTVTFAVPLASMPGFVPARARFGLAAGFIANGPITWVKVGETLAQPPTRIPLDGPAFGQAQLLRASARVEGDALRADLVFDAPPALETAWDLMGLVDADGDAETGYHGAEWLLQSCPLGSTPQPGLKVQWLDARPGIAVPGQTVIVTGWLLNDGKDAFRGVTARLAVPDGTSVAPADASAAFDLQPGDARRFRWVVRVERPGPLPLRLQVSGAGRSLRKTRWITVVKQKNPRGEFETADGHWLLYPERPTLQQGNATTLDRITPKPSSALKRNLFGITAHLPRSVNDEDPFVPTQALDGDPATCWASRWWRVAVPLEPEWLQTDLGRAITAQEVRFLPARGNAGLPAAFTLEVSPDGARWEAIAAERDYHAQTQPEGNALRVGDRCWQRFPFASRPVRYARLTATRLTQGPTSFFCAPYDPFQLRVAEIALVNDAGAVARPVRASASTTHNAWFNAPETTTKTWPLLLSSGVKLNRISQWGDRLDWATVEKTKGVYRIPAEADAAITQSHLAGVETLLTLDYGNNLYQQVKNAPDFGVTWQRGHPFLQCAPTTPEAVAGFARFCGFMARHFRGRVKYFEIWNEENGWFFDDWAKGGNVAQVHAYGRALKAAAQAVKQANPEAVVVFGGTAGMTFDYPRIALEEGAGPWVDVFAFHPYGHPTPESVPDNFLTLVGENMDWRPRPAGITNYETEIAALRQLLHQYNPKMQVWADEMNWFAPGEPPTGDQGDQSELTQAKHLARFYTMNAWVGCGAVWWSLYNANGVQEWAVVRSADLTPRAAWYAAQYTSTVLDDVRPVHNIKPVVLGKKPVDLIVKPFSNGQDETLIALWRTSFGSDSCRPEPITISVPGLQATGGELLDLLYGTRQKAQIVPAADGITLTGLLVGDWPLVVRLPAARRITH